MFVGIDDINFYASDYYLPLSELAAHNGEDPEKYLTGIGQYQMGILPLDEDIVTMAANAATPLVLDHPERIRTLLFATESGIDQSKSAGIYAHTLLNLNENVRIVELKQACYSATAALQMACAMVARQPEHEVLILASDVARYGLNTPGEPTQGCGAVAMRITANPRLLLVNPEFGCYSEDVMDFWRPNYLDTALVNGKYSTQIYLKALRNSWKNYVIDGGKTYDKLSRFCYHLPFGKMGEKAHKKLAVTNNVPLSDEAISKILEPTLFYSRHVGNTYAASLYICLLSLIENDKENLENQHIGLFSYGSGCVGEFFSVSVQPGYQQFSRQSQHVAKLKLRISVNYEKYASLFNHQWPANGETFVTPKQTKGLYRLEAIRNHQRIYTSNSNATGASRYCL